MAYPRVLLDLIHDLKQIPGVGDRSAERYAFSFLEMNRENVEDIAEKLIDCHNNLHPCEICGHITDKNICDICSDETRDKNVICVLEDSKNVFAFERAGNYRGVYHVLKGLISPIDDINPEDINLSSLIKRVGELDHPELIIALKSTVEGQTTSLYIQKIFEKKNVTLSRLSYGIAMGAEIDYLDEVTLDRALSDRKKIS